LAQTSCNSTIGEGYNENGSKNVFVFVLVLAGAGDIAHAPLASGGLELSNWKY
jgi:hypothetical protein